MTRVKSALQKEMVKTGREYITRAIKKPNYLQKKKSESFVNNKQQPLGC